MESPNGSSITLYGHATGISILWRGGLRPRGNQEIQDLRRSHTTTESFNGEDGMVMVQDREGLSNQLEQQTSSHGLNSGWEEHEEQEECASVVACAEISMGSSVSHVAVPSLPVDAATSNRHSIPSLLTRKLVAAVACADRSTHLVSFPLKPLAPTLSFLSATAPEHCQFEDIVISGPNTHRSSPRKVALSFTRRQSIKEAVPDATRVSSDLPSVEDQNPWSLLMASHSAEPCGLLLVSKISITEHDGEAGLEDESLQRLCTLNISTPVVSMEFNPARYPSSRHTQLLLGESAGPVRILDTLSATRYDVITDDTVVPTNISNRHEWLLTLFSPFQSVSKGQPGLSSTSSSRSRILDAKWILNGKGVISLYGDGLWGLWNIEGAGPNTRTNETGAASHSVGISGGGVTKFSLHSSLGRNYDFVLPKTGQKSIEGKKLAPMTPNTRKVKQESLFGNSSQGLKTAGLIQGGISVSVASGSANRASRDDSVLMWYGTDIFAIPSLMSYWQRAISANASSSTIGGSTYGPSPMQLTSISTLGERITNIAQFPRESSSGQATSARQVPHDVLVSAEHRLVFFCPPKPREQQMRELKASADRTSGLDPTTRDLQAVRERMNAKEKAGNLSVEEIDREVARLKSTMLSQRPGLFDDEPRPRHVGFATGTRQ